MISDFNPYLRAISNALERVAVNALLNDPIIAKHRKLTQIFRLPIDINQSKTNN
jgi:hypothetical protein